MSANSQAPKPPQGIKRNAQGQPVSQNKQGLGLSPEQQHALDQIPTLKLISVFEPAIREHVKRRMPTADIEQIMEKVKTVTDREKIIELVSILPQVIPLLKESRSREGNLNQPAHSQSQDVQMEISPRLSPPPPYQALPVPSTPSQSHVTPSNATSRPPTEATGMVAPPREKTVLYALYTPGRGKNKTSEKEFTISEDNYVRACAWARRVLRFDRSNEHLMYHLKVVLTSDMEALLDALKAVGIVDPSSQGTGTNNAVVSQEERDNAKGQYDRIVAQSAYKLQASWPPSPDFLINLNYDKSQELSPKHGSDPYIDVTEIIKKGANKFTLVEFKDMRRYIFCLFERSPTGEEIEQADSELL